MEFNVCNVCMYVCMHACMHIYIYIHMCVCVGMRMILFNTLTVTSSVSCQSPTRSTKFLWIAKDHSSPAAAGEAGVFGMRQWPRLRCLACYSNREYSAAPSIAFMHDRLTPIRLAVVNSAMRVAYRGQQCYSADLCIRWKRLQQANWLDNQTNMQCWKTIEHACHNRLAEPSKAEIETTATTAFGFNFEAQGKSMWHEMHEMNELDPSWSI